MATSSTLGAVPGLTTFVTLSPVPGLAKWLRQEGLEQLSNSPEELRQMAAHYLLDAKTPDDRPLDPVARLHLGNGALVQAVHPGADTSDTGMEPSHGAMVNFLFDLSRISQNVRLLSQRNEVAAVTSMKSLARQAAKAINARQSVSS